MVGISQEIQQFRGGGVIVKTATHLRESVLDLLWCGAWKCERCCCVRLVMVAEGVHPEGLRNRLVEARVGKTHALGLEPGGVVEKQLVGGDQALLSIGEQEWQFSSACIHRDMRKSKRNLLWELDDVIIGMANCTVHTVFVLSFSSTLCHSQRSRQLSAVQRVRPGSCRQTHHAGREVLSGEVLPHPQTGQQSDGRRGRGRA